MRKMNSMLPRSLWLFFMASMMIGLRVSAEPSANWPRWRGSHDNGSNDHGVYPVQFDANLNVLWKVPLPGKGCSTPIVWDQCVYLTAPVDGQDALLAFDWPGQALWRTNLGPH